MILHSRVSDDYYCSTEDSGVKLSLLVLVFNNKRKYKINKV